jgi:hypothetical protein
MSTDRPFLNTSAVCPIPRWIYQILVRNKIDIMDFRNYGKVRGVLSLNDLRDWAYVDEAFSPLYATYGNKNLFWFEGFKLSYHFQNLTVEQLKELEYSVQPLVGMEENKLYMRNRLTTMQDGMPVVEIEDAFGIESKTYTFVKDTHVVYIIVDEGIINTLQTKKGAFNFSKKCVDQFYSMMSSGRASSLGIYSVYLKELQGSVL